MATLANRKESLIFGHYVANSLRPAAAVSEKGRRLNEENMAKQRDTKIDKIPHSSKKNHIQTVQCK